MKQKQHYAMPRSAQNRRFSGWDVLILLLVLAIFMAMAMGTQGMSNPYELGDKLEVTLDPWMLPLYSLHSVVRMAIALFLSFAFTFTIGTLAAKSRRAERIILPFIDIMQSIPILGFQSISIMTFIFLFQGSRLGPECAAIFAIFTSQVWNMALSFYQSLRTLPKDLKEASAIFQLNAWQQFWRMEVPYAMPALLWNTMISLSAGWFFVVASEAISVNQQHITLPGIGSYIHLALLQENTTAIGYAVGAMFLIILMYDQMIFRPLLTWSERFKPEPNPDIDYEGTWFLNLLSRSLIWQKIKVLAAATKSWLINIQLPTTKSPPIPPKIQKAIHLSSLIVIQGVIFIGILLSLYVSWEFLSEHVTLKEVQHVFYLGLITAVKVTILIIAATLLWVPIGTYIGLSPRLARIAQPVAQFAAAFPADILYPSFMMMIIAYKLNPEIWSTPLMILGTQWYILFNVIAGVQALPTEIKDAAKSYGVKGWLWWKRVMLPTLFPYYVTGAMAAAGGCWNASIIADVISWGDKKLYVQGIGSYISQATHEGDFPRIALGIGIMCFLVMIINRMVWLRLYHLAETRFQMEDNE